MPSPVPLLEYQSLLGRTLQGLARVLDRQRGLGVLILLLVIALLFYLMNSSLWSTILVAGLVALAVVYFSQERTREVVPYRYDVYDPNQQSYAHYYATYSYPYHPSAPTTLVYTASPALTSGPLQEKEDYAPTLSNPSSLSSNSIPSNPCNPPSEQSTPPNPLGLSGITVQGIKLSNIKNEPLPRRSICPEYRSTGTTFCRRSTSK